MNLGLGVVVMYLVAKLGQLVLLEWLCELGSEILELGLSRVKHATVPHFLKVFYLL